MLCKTEWLRDDDGGRPETMATKWVARRYREGDETLIFRLRKAIRGVPHSERYWRWRYVDNPAGRAIIWLAVADGIAVGHSAMIPTTLKVGSTVIRAGLSVDAWTHPDFRHQGVFATVRSKVLEDAVNQGIKFAYSFPNVFSYPQIMKLGYSYLFPVPLMVKVVNWGSVLKARIRAPLIERVGDLFSEVVNIPVRALASPGVELRKISYFDERFDKFWLRVSQYHGVTIVRDSRYLNWKYVDDPRYEYTIYEATRRNEVLGYVVLNCLTTDLVRGYIGDLLILPDEHEVFHALIGKSIEHFRTQEADTIHCWMLENTPYYKVLRGRGFHRRPLHSVRFCGRALAEGVPELVRYSRNWFLCPGDYDIQEIGGYGPGDYDL